jgi:aspartate/methionine/tyrosine aminotransferase
VLARLPKDIKCDDKAFVEKALELERFSAVPASVFGAPNCIRFGYAGMTKEAIMNLSQNLQDVLNFLRS